MLPGQRPHRKKQASFQNQAATDALARFVGTENIGRGNSCQDDQADNQCCGKHSRQP